MRVLAGIVLALSLVCAGSATAADLTGRWAAVITHAGVAVTEWLQLVQTGGAIGGDLGGGRIAGTADGDAIRFVADDGKGGYRTATMALHGDALVGVISIEQADGAPPYLAKVTATRAP